MWLFDLLFPTTPRDKKMCKNKVRFKNEPAAIAALNRINPRRAANKPIRAYRCPRCRGYHLTSSRA